MLETETWEEAMSPRRWLNGSCVFAGVLCKFLIASIKSIDAIDQGKPDRSCFIKQGMAELESRRSTEAARARDSDNHDTEIGPTANSRQFIVARRWLPTATVGALFSYLEIDV